MFLIAGYETTSTTLTACAYELALNPDIQQKLYDEINGAIDSDGEIPYDVLTRLPYLDAVLSEALRLHTPPLRFARTASADYTLGDTGIIIKKGQQVEIPIHAIHLSAEYYPDPFRFNPDRFMPENRGTITPYTYLPFGGGPRNCIGMRFALLEAKLCLAHMIGKYRLFRCQRTDDQIQCKRFIRLAIPKRLV
ncbi:unnamed protein product, partial [Oppiella nova]